MTALLDHPTYIDYLARTHPALQVEHGPLEVPSFTAPLDTREPLLPGFWKTLASAASQLSPEHVVPPSLFLGTPFERYDQTHLLDDVNDPVALARRASDLAAERRLHLVVITNVSPAHARFAAFQDAGFTSLPSFPDTVVDLAGSWPEHLSRLPAGDRSGIRRNIRKFERAGHHLERLAATEPEVDALWRAYRPMYERAKVRWQPHTPAYFADLDRLDDRVRVTAARESEGGALIGFVINFADTDRDGAPTFQGGRVGVLPAYHRRDAVYFRLLYHLVEQSIALGGKRLSLEPTSYRTKRHLGARAVPLVNLVLAVSPSWRMVLASLAPIGRRMLGHLEDQQRLEEEY